MQGPHVTAGGVHFSIYSKHATAVYLCLFDNATDSEPSNVITLSKRERFVWHVFVGGCGPGQLYLYRVDGPWAPCEGMRFNPYKYLLDPYARAITGKHRWNRGEHHAWDESDPSGMTMSTVSNVEGCPRCVVTDDSFDWGDDVHPSHPMNRTIIYEMHLGGFTRHPSSAVRNPGTYLGAIEKIPHLLELGVNAVELLPVHETVTDEFLIGRGLTNYWGYNTIGFLAPDSRFRVGVNHYDQVREFKQMVVAFHRAGIEVILDVVYNHTGEGDHRGPSLCFRGIDNATYYHLLPDDRSRYLDFTGCGNTFNFDSPQVIKFVMDSLRYWVEVMHVDGFRFDLASALGRQNTHFNRLAAFFVTIHQDPVLSEVKLIAEPWDCADGSYQVGNFPEDWSEWNGRYRDTLRKFVKGDAGQLKDLGARLTGSADLYRDDGRTPYHSINFVTCHDGFTLNDLVSYERKHNEQNGEHNRDGNDWNDSSNYGFEGDASDAQVLELRRRQVRNFMLILVISRGVPMLQMGDESLRTQNGNNNAYCLDSPVTWLDWSRMDGERARFMRFTWMLLRLRAAHPVLRQPSFCKERYAEGGADIEWSGPDGQPAAWDSPEAREVAFRLDGSRTSRPDGSCDNDLFIILNMSAWPRTFALPPPPAGMSWRRVADTSLPDGKEIVEDQDAIGIEPAGYYIVNPHTSVVLVAMQRTT